MDNSLVPATGAPPPEPQIGDMLDQAHQQAKDLFGKTTKHLNTLGNIQQALTKLAGMGDSVTPDDVIEEAGKLVSQGLPPHDMAVLLSDMPQGGQVLAQWVAQHAQAVTQGTGQVQQLQAVARHEVGTSAGRALMHHPGLAAPVAQAAPPGPDNPLMPGGPGNAN